MKKLLYIIILLFTFAFKTNHVLADTYVAGSSSSLKAKEIKDYENYDYRIMKLKSYLKSHNSPLYEYADEFVKEADMYDLDWRFVPAIAGVESTFGKRIPFNSYNAYGWANGNYYFDSWPESINTVTKTLREEYIEKGAVSINQIARRYAPPSSTWSWKVQFFMNEIDSTSLTFTL